MALIGSIWVEDTLVIHPLSAGKVGEVNRHATLSNGLLGERSNDTPAGCIIDVLWSGRLFLDRLDESITHKVVHAAVTRTFGLLCVESPQLRVKFILIFIKFLPLMWFAAPANMDSITVHIPQAIGALRAKPQRIGTRQ